MHPVLFQWGAFHVYSFGAVIALTLLVALGWATRRAGTMGLDETMATDALCWLVFMGLVGAKLFYFLFFPGFFLADPLAALMSQGGLVWYGGLLAAILTLAVFARVRAVSFWQLLDLFAPPAALGLALGRIGCLLAGCCYGAPCDLPWAITYPHGHETGGLPVHPSPLYETALMLASLPLLLAVDRKKRHAGQTAGCLLIVYGLVRFVLEYFRGDRLVWLAAWNLSASQLISIGIALAGVGILVWRARAAKSPSTEP